ncbi:sodium:solute symporter family protein [Lentisphaera araneosa HTCC2155]|uniref:Sodium:solute symporter family protein n=1 Tax=Lentisphaera araneosa HTCC2155 TaxID=313628 RepID=A6DHA4_9BACT|nr:sodium:solute symporter family protein [Lentisphaera araneosa]EDM28987.1 sodium:solute symporter family protein [Lentisphaera araneosa HTCC2155]
MSQDIWNFIFIGITFGIYIGIALWAKAGSTKEYYTAGGGVSALANGMATGADWMSAATFISMAGIVAASGYDASRFLMGWTGGFVLLTTLMVPYLRKFGKATVPDFIGDRFYSKTARLVAVFCAIFICMTYIMGQMRGVGIVFSRLFNIEIATGVIIGGSIVFFYAGLGGMKGITYTQVAQYCVMVFAYTIPVIFISLALTGNVIPQMGLIGDFTKGGEAVPLLQKMNDLSVELGVTKYTDGSLSTTDMFCITAALMAGTAGLPHVIVRFFTVKSVKAVRKSACWTLFFIAIIYLTAPALGLFARTNLVDELNNKSYTEAPSWFKNWEDQGMIAWVDKNNDGIIQYGKGKAFAGKPIMDGEKRGEQGQRIVKNEVTSDPNEVYYDRDIIVLANPEMAGLPKWLIALVMAGCVAAALSTAAGLLLVLSTSISHDLMKKIIKPDITDKQEMAYARMASFGALVIASYFGINPPSSFVAKTVAFAFGLAASSFFPTLLMGIFSKRVNKEGAIVGMICGISFTFAYIVYFQFIAEHQNYLFGISPEGIGFVGMFINFIVTIVISSFTPAPPQEVQDMVEHIRIPSGAGEASH